MGQQEYEPLCVWMLLQSSPNSDLRQRSPLILPTLPRRRVSLRARCCPSVRFDCSSSAPLRALWSYTSWLTFSCFSFCTCEVGMMILLPAKVVRKNKELTHLQRSEQWQSRKPSIRTSCSDDTRSFLLCTQHRWCAHPHSGLAPLMQSKTGSRNHLCFPWAEIFLPKAYPVGWCCLLWTQSSQEETKTMLANKSG